MKQKKTTGKALAIGIIAIMLLGCGKDKIESSAENALETGNLLIGQTDSIYAKTKDFPDKTQMAFGFIKNGQVDHYGTLRLNDTLITVENKDKAFEIGSITKVFAATI